MCTLLCVCPPRVESLFPPVLSKSCNQIPLAFKVWFSGNSSSCCWKPRLGSLMWGSEPSLQWVDFCGIIVLQFVSHPFCSYGIWFFCDCAPPTISLWRLLCLWMWGIFFGLFQCLPVKDCSAVSYDSGPLARGSWMASFFQEICPRRTEVEWIILPWIVFATSDKSNTYKLRKIQGSIKSIDWLQTSEDMNMTISLVRKRSS